MKFYYAVAMIALIVLVAPSVSKSDVGYSEVTHSTSILFPEFNCEKIELFKINIFISQDNIKNEINGEYVIGLYNNSPEYNKAVIGVPVGRAKKLELSVLNNFVIKVDKEKSPKDTLIPLMYGEHNSVYGNYFSNKTYILTNNLPIYGFNVYSHPEGKEFSTDNHYKRKHPTNVFFEQGFRPKELKIFHVEFNASNSKEIFFDIGSSKLWNIRKSSLSMPDLVMKIRLNDRIDLSKIETNMDKYMHDDKYLWWKLDLRDLTRDSRIWLKFK